MFDESLTVRLAQYPERWTHGRSFRVRVPVWARWVHTATHSQQRVNSCALLRWDGKLTGIAPESDRAVLLAIGGCATMDRIKQIAINTQVGTQPDLAKQRGSTEHTTRLRPRHPVGHRWPADIVVWSKGKSVNMHSEKALSCAESPNQEERSEFDKKRHEPNRMKYTEQYGSTKGQPGEPVK